MKRQGRYDLGSPSAFLGPLAAKVLPAFLVLLPMEPRAWLSFTTLATGAVEVHRSYVFPSGFGLLAFGGGGVRNAASIASSALSGYRLIGLSFGVWPF